MVKFLLDNWMLLAVALASGGMLMWPAVRGGGPAGSVSPAAAVQLMNREKAVVVDVCESAEYAQGHILGAKSVPLGQFEQRLPEVVKNKTVPLIVVCASGARARRALGTAKNLGYDKAVLMAGGMAAWKEANLPLEKS